MGRTPRVWARKGRGYWSTINKRQVYLSHDLKEARRKLKALATASTPILPGQFSVAQLVTLFLADCDKRVAKDELSPATVVTHRAYLLRWADACRRVRPEHLEVYHLDLWVESHGWGASAAATAISRVKTWSRWIRKKGYTKMNNLADATAPRQSPRDAADPADLLKLEAAITDPHFADFFAVLYDTGCRPGELKSITAASVDWTASSATVRGKSGERVVGLTERALAILRRLALLRPEGSLLVTARGCEWSPDNVNATWKKWRAVAGVPDTLVPYHCRHTLYVRLHDAGVDDVVVAAQLGHFEHGAPHLHLLRSTYAHVEGRHLAAAVQAASAPRATPRRKISRP